MNVSSRLLFSISLCALLDSTANVAFAQGNLTPPGAPAPTMKTLAQIEPRTPISSLPYHITNSGSYYVTANLTNTAVNGITISVSDVTVDLNGFTLFGGASSSEGIVLDDGIRNVALLNGTVRNWGDYGVRAYTAFVVVCERIRTLGNFQGGIGLSSNGVARACLADNNAFYGIYATSGSVVEDCSISNNGGDGIQAESGCSLLNNYLSGNNTNLMNSGAAINVTGSGCRIEGNQVVNNWLKGVQDIFGGSSNVIIRNTARGNSVTNYNVSASSALGPLITLPGVITNLNPWANFSY